jgi:phage terminase large subunit-like protein
MPLRGRGARKKPFTKTVQAPSPPDHLAGSRVHRLIHFLEGLPITKGHLQGQRMRLLPAQSRFIRAVYGQPGIRLAVLSAPRGNGKTGLLSALTLAHLLGPESLPRGECYSAAVDRDQSALLYREMQAIIWALPEFDGRVNCIKHFKRIEVLAGVGSGSTLRGDERRCQARAWFGAELLVLR